MKPIWQKIIALFSTSRKPWSFNPWMKRSKENKLVEPEGREYRGLLAIGSLLKRRKTIIFLLLSSAFLIFTVLVIGIQSTAFTGFPKGYDSFPHLSVIKIIRDNFPHILWNPYWDEGSVLFPRNYPPLYHFSLGILARLFSLDLPGLVKWTAAVNLILTSIFLFLTVYLLTKNLTASLATGLFYPASSSVWFYLLTPGLYPGIFAMMTLALAVFALTYFFTEGKKKWAYGLAVFGVTLVFLSHFLAVMMLGAFLFFLVFFQEGNFREKIVRVFKVLIPAILLSAFFYLPFFFVTSEHIMGEVSKESYEPLSLTSLFRQDYPGFPFLSIPLAFFLLLIVFLTREKTKGEPKDRFFWIFALCAFACLSYVLGLYRNYFSGISPTHFLLPTVFFLAPFVGLGLAVLRKRQVLSSKTLFLVVLVLATLSLAQVGVLKKNAGNMSSYWPQLSFTTLDKNRLFRFAHREEVLGGAFNYYSSTLQTGGYWEPGLLHPDFHFWFEEEVFAKNDNLTQTKFLLDWFGVRGLYTGRLSQDKRLLQPDPKFGNSFFASVGQSEWLYTQSTPILVALNSPVIWVKTSEDGYEKILRGLAEKGYDSSTVVPLWVKNPEEARENPVSSWEEMEEHLVKISTVSAALQLQGQKPKFIHSQRREIELGEKFQGVLLKENYFPNWRAFLQPEANSPSSGKVGRQQTSNLKIYLAGPGMMYVLLPDYTPPAKVTFEYQSSLIEKIGLLISFLTFLLILIRIFIIVLPKTPGVARR